MRFRRFYLFLSVLLVTWGSGVAALGVTGPAGSDQFVARVTVGDGVGPGGRRCSGALVAPQWIITVKTCFGDSVTVGAPPAPTTIRIGYAAALSTVAAERVVPHPDRDVALVRLATPVAGIAPIRFGADRPQYRQVLTVAGYGRTATEWLPDQPHAASTRIRSADTPTFGVDATLCQGDAGGPAFRVRDGVPELVGLHVAGWQQGCLGSADYRSGAEEVRVHDLASWIRSVVVETPLPDAHLYRQPDGKIAETVGGALIWFETFDEIHAAGFDGSTTPVPDGLFALLPAVPADDTVVRDEAGAIYVIDGGAKVWFGTADELRATEHVTAFQHQVPSRWLATLPDVPRDGTLLRAANGDIFLTVGGARIWMASPAEINTIGYATASRVLLPDRYLAALPGTPRDGTAVIDEHGSLNVIKGGGRLHIRTWDEFYDLGYRDVPVTKVPARWLGTLPEVPPTGPAPVDTPPSTETATGSLAEEGAYPDAAAIEAAQNIRLISGDGHILLADCATAPVGNIGVLKVWTTEPVGTGGAGLACFRVLTGGGLLNLQVPGVYEIRGDGQVAGSGHHVTATVTTDAGVTAAVAVDPSGSTQVGIGSSPDADPTTLLQLKVTS